MKIPSDDEIRARCNAVGSEDGITLTIAGESHFFPRYVAFRLSHFLDRAIIDSCNLSGKKVDEGFSR